jgi:hypothetical protein
MFFVQQGQHYKPDQAFEIIIKRSSQFNLFIFQEL